MTDKVVIEKSERKQEVLVSENSGEPKARKKPEGYPPSREKTICNNILDKLNATVGCHAEKTHGGMYGTAGKPDIIGCYIGAMFVIEVKTIRGKPTKLQSYRLKKWAEAGAIAGVVRSWEETKQLLHIEQGISVSKLGKPLTAEDVGYPPGERGR